MPNQKFLKELINTGMKLLRFILSTAVILLSGSLISHAYSPHVTFGDNRTLDFNPSVWCTVDGRFTDFNSNGVPFLCYTENLPEGLVNYIPVRTVAEALGLQVSFDEASYSVELSGNGKIMSFTPGSADIILKNIYNEENETSYFCTPTQIPCPVRLIDGTVYVPIRPVSESFGFIIDYSDNHLSVGSSYDLLYSHSKNELAKTVEIYGLNLNVSVANDTNMQNYNKFLEQNGLSDLTGFVCRADNGWKIASSSNTLTDFDMIIPSAYLGEVYFKSGENSAWTQFSDDETISSIYDVSYNIKEAATDKNGKLLFDKISDISDPAYRAVFECMNQNTGLFPKMTLESYAAMYSPIITDKTTDSVLYRIQDKASDTYFYILFFDNHAKWIDQSLFNGYDFNKNITVSLPEQGSLTVYSEIITVDITDA